MGRMIKNSVPRNASHAIGIPTGTSTVTPNASTYGQVQYRTDTNKLQYWGSNTSGTYGAYPIAREGNVTVVADKSFVGTGSQVLFQNMSYTYNAGQEAQVIVFAGTVYQIPGTNYTFAGNASIQFTSAPSNGAAITILHNFASTAAA